MSQTINTSIANDLVDEAREYWDCDSTSEAVTEIRDFWREKLREEVMDD